MNYLLDAAKKATGSDRKTAKAIVVTEQLISNVRNGHRKLTPYQAAKIAELIGESWSDHALPVMVEQAKTAAEKEYWLDKLESLRNLNDSSVMAAKLESASIRSIDINNQSLEIDRNSYTCRT